MQTVKLDDGLYRTDADNGVTVLSESLPGVRSVAVGIWVQTASAHEARHKMGISHLLEHMVFKGTERRSARDIALELESRGGALDAYTARDHTAYQARILDEDLPRALDVLTDLVRNPMLRAGDLELERKVILEEISTVEDTPDDLVFDIHHETLWPSHPYGYAILGTRETVGGLSTDDLRTLHERAYHPRHVVIAAAGQLNHEVLLKLVAKCGWLTLPPGPDPLAIEPVPPAERVTKRVRRDTQQTHVVLGTDAFPHRDPRRGALVVLNTVLGGGMSSRLFQRVREELGLAYSVYAFQSFYRATGITGVYVGTHPRTADAAVDVIREELRRIAREGLSARELAEAQQQVKGGLTLSLEPVPARMYRLAGCALNDEPYQTLDDALREIDAITPEQTAEVAGEFLDPDRQTTVWLGPN